MLAKLQDMCTQYWPDKVDGEVTYDKMTLKLLSEKCEKEIIVRKLEISQTLKVVRYTICLQVLYQYEGYTWQI